MFLRTAPSTVWTEPLARSELSESPANSERTSRPAATTNAATAPIGRSQASGLGPLEVISRTPMIAAPIAT